MKKDNWILKVFLLTFILSIVFSGISNVIATNFNEIVLLFIIIIVIFIGIIFDMIGTSSISAKEATFHSMSSNKIKGAKEAIMVIKHKDQIASICNDVIGDICGIVSGGLGAVLALAISTKFSISLPIISVIIAAFISSLTVGGKAISKRIALKKADNIIFFVGKVKNILKLK